jgi:hypothetical protein
MTRAEHLAWAKQRAIDYVDRGELSQAVASMLSDLDKHDATRLNPSMAAFIGMAGIMECQRGADAVRHWVKGFNRALRYLGTGATTGRASDGAIKRGTGGAGGGDGGGAWPQPVCVAAGARA